MPVYSPPPETPHGAPAGIYYRTGNDEAMTSSPYAASLRISLEQSTFWQTKKRFANARQRLGVIAHLAPGWDSYGSELPNTRARSLAARILDLLETVALPPTQLTPSVEGGIAISFVDGNARAVIEIYNTGEIAAATYSDQADPTVWEPTDSQLLGSIERIRVHLAA